MSVLPGGQPLDRVLPDLDELLDDPHAYLSAAPLAFGPRQMYGLATVFALPGVAFLLACVAEGKFDGERLALGIGSLLGAAAWAGWSLWLRGHELVLHPDGVEVIYYETSVWVPWALFRVEGRPFAPDPAGGLTLPIDPKLAGYARQSRLGVVLATGRAVAGPQWRFLGRDEVLLPGRYEINTLDVGELLLVLGQRLGRTPPAGEPPPEEPPADAPAEAVAGWVTLPLTRLRLPPCCARCLGPRDDTLTVRVAASVELRVPVCQPCKDRIEARQRRGGFFGLGLGAVAGVAVGLGLAVGFGEGRDEPLWLGTALGSLLGAMLGSVVGMVLMRGLPVRLRRYSPSRGVVSARFENPQVAARVLESLRESDSSPLL